MDQFYPVKYILLKMVYCIFLGFINLTSQPFRLTSTPAAFDGGSFGGSLLVGKVKVERLILIRFLIRVLTFLKQKSG